MSLNKSPERVFDITLGESVIKNVAIVPNDPTRRVKESEEAQAIHSIETSDCSRTEPEIPEVNALPTAVVCDAEAPSRVITVTDAREGIPRPKLLIAKTLNAAV